MSNEFKGQVALVTGASRGIGRAIAVALAQRGLKVIGTATSESGAQSISEGLSGFEGCKGIVLNVTDAAGVDAAVDAIIKEHGALHVLVNNAGITRDMLAMRLKDEDWDAVIDTNLKAVFRMSRAVMRPMMKQRHGRIISITSVVGAAGNPGQANYAAAKAGVMALTRCAAVEAADVGVRINAVAPSIAKHPFLAKVTSDELLDELASKEAYGRAAEVWEVAATIAMLASDYTTYLTGEVVSISSQRA